MKHAIQFIFAVALTWGASTAANSADRITIATVYGDAYPLQAIGFPPNAIHPSQFDGLTEIAANGTLSPALALTWTLEDQRTWVFELRPNVVFSNGEPVDAGAVAATIKHILSTEGKRTSAYREVADVMAVETRAPLTVAITTQRTDLFLPHKLVSVKILPPAYFQNVGISGFSNKPVGTGPFVETFRSPGRVEMARNPTAWRKPKFDELVFLNLPDATTRVQALVSGQADIALDVSVDEADFITSNGYQTYAFPTGSVEVVQFVTVRPGPLQDVRVRRALNHAVDRKRITQAMLHNYTKPASQFAAPLAFGYHPALAFPYAYDPDRARGLLAEAGYPNGFELQIDLMNSVDSAPYEQVASDLRSVGVNVRLDNLTVQTYTRHYYANTWEGDAFYSGYNAAPSMDALAPLRLHSCLWPNAWHCDKAMMPSIEAAQIATTWDERLRLTRGILREMNDDPPALLLYDAFKIFGLADHISGMSAPLGLIRYTELENAALLKD